MRIWLVNQYAAPPSRGGITRHHTLAHELMRRGHDVTLIASSFDHVTRTETSPAMTGTHHDEITDGVPFIWVRTPGYAGNTHARVRNMLAFAWRVWQLKSRARTAAPDVILGSSPHLLAALAAERLARSFGVPFVLEIRDLWPQSLVDLGALSERHPTVMGLRVIERYLYRHAARIVTVLPGVPEYLVARGVPGEKVTWIPNGVNFELAPEPTPPSGHAPLTVLYAGAHGMANHLDTAIDAARVLQLDGGHAVRFRFVGDGPEKARLQDDARRSGLQNVEFADPVPKTLIYDVLSGADALLVMLKDSPVFQWGVSPNKLYDYMAAGRPVIFCVRTPTNPVSENDAGFCVPPGDPAALADAVRRLSDMSNEERWSMGRRGRNYVQERHDLRKLSGTLEGVLIEALSARTVPLPAPS